MTSEKDVVDSKENLFESQLREVKLALSKKKESEAFSLINELVELGDESNPRFYLAYFYLGEGLVPKSLQKYFSEKLIYMPEGSYSMSLKELPNNRLKRKDFGLPENEVVFCCFNKTQRINEAVFKVWMNILNEVKGSVLWLDTFTLSAGTGVILCAHVGLPVLTLAGETPQSRVGAGVAVAANAEEMVCHSIEEYQKRAIDFGNHPEKLKAIKERLIKGRATMPLFNPKRFIRHLEKAYHRILKNYIDGNEPKTMTIEKLPD